MKSKPQVRAVKKTELPEWYLDMRSWSHSHDDLPDGAFFALAEEMEGWTVDDWISYSEVAKTDPINQPEVTTPKRGGKKMI